MRFETTRCRQYGAPELAFDLEDPAVHAQGGRWVERIEARARDGERWSAGQLFVLDGWPALLVDRGGFLELHGEDLTRSGDAAPAFACGMTDFARFSAEQWAEAEAYGVASEFAPPDYLERLSICPQLETSTGRFVMQRSRPIVAGISGWVAQCGWYCISSEGPGGQHVRASHWREISVCELIRMRPGLLRYLALPVGFRLESPLTGPMRVLRWRSDDMPPPEHNEGFLQFPILPPSFGEVLPSRNVSDEVEPERVALDFARDADVWTRGLDPLHQRAIVRERHRVSDATAARSVAHYMAPAMLRERVRWCFREELSSEHIALVEARLREGSSDAWKAAHAAAMALRTATGRPFAPLMKIVQGLQSRLAEADRGEWS